MVTGLSSSSPPANTAAPMAMSTRVAIAPPCTVPPWFRWRASAVIVAVALSSLERDTSMPRSSPRCTVVDYPRPVRTRRHPARMDHVDLLAARPLGPGQLPRRELCELDAAMRPLVDPDR